MMKSLCIYLQAGQQVRTPIYEASHNCRLVFLTAKAYDVSLPPNMQSESLLALSEALWLGSTELLHLIMHVNAHKIVKLQTKKK